jgi:hypothetical protein
VRLQLSALRRKEKRLSIERERIKTVSAHDEIQALFGSSRLNNRRGRVSILMQLSLNRTRIRKNGGSEKCQEKNNERGGRRDVRQLLEK